VEVVVAQAVGGQPVDVRRLDQTTEAPHLCKPDIIEQEDDDVGRVILGPLFGRPPFLGIAIPLSDDTTKAFDSLRLDTGRFVNRIL